jgi:branched-chain amino acid aminotransferase
MNERCVYLSGQFIDESKASISIRDTGWLYGETLTTTMRTFAHQPFRVDQHVARLFRSARAARMALDLSPDQVRDVIVELVQRNAPLLAPADDYRMDIDISPGVLDVGTGRMTDSGPTVVMACTPLGFAAWARAFVDGCSLATPTSRWVPAACIDPRIKHRSRLLYRIATREAALVDPNAFLPLMLNLDGDVTETTGSNFFIVAGGKLVTAPTHQVLDGVCRAATFEAAETLGIEVIEKTYQLMNVYDADEAFITSTPFVLLPVTKVNHIPIGTGAPGPVTGRVLEQWNELAGIDVAAQAKAHLPS